MMRARAATLESRRRATLQNVEGFPFARRARMEGRSRGCDTSLADRGLVESLHRGDADAAEHLVARYGGYAYRLAIRICGNEQDAEEVVQDAFWAVIRKVDAFRGEAAFSTWLHRIVANAALQKLRARRRGRVDASLDDALPVFDGRGRHVAPMDDWSTRLTNTLTRTELLMTLTSAIEELPADARAVLLLHDMEGWSSSEIADAFSLSVPAVKARVHRARLFLRKRLGNAVLGSESSPPEGRRRAESEAGG
jgi:RNA polymerase sigma-70 factor (ECF subfamily)